MIRVARMLWCTRSRCGLYSGIVLTKKNLLTFLRQSIDKDSYHNSHYQLSPEIWLRRWFEDFFQST